VLTEVRAEENCTCARDRSCPSKTRREIRGVHEEGKFTAVTDYRKRRVKGLQIRKGSTTPNSGSNFPRGKSQPSASLFLMMRGNPINTMGVSQRMITILDQYTRKCHVFRADPAFKSRDLV
jgi:hypothetical protein